MVIMNLIFYDNFIYFVILYCLAYILIGFNLVSKRLTKKGGVHECDDGDPIPWVLSSGRAV